tara:strand:+ start:770 stop:1204 length:435 start_codon:yes stop_codon:yes gene_type:complete
MAANPNVIIWTEDDGQVSICHPISTYSKSLDELAKKVVPSGKSYKIIKQADIPTDRTFRGAWVQDGDTAKEDVAKSKTIAHSTRREKREAEFKPHDDIIAKQIPGKSASDAETARAAIRTKYATMQTNIDNATDIAGIKTALGG